jgi:hypothetical protein
VDLYREARRLGLTGIRRRRASIQLASSLRNLGAYDDALAVILAEHERSADGPYRDAVATVHALILASSGKPAQGLSVALLALVPHLPRYHRSMTAYAHEIAELDA